MENKLLQQWDGVTRAQLIEQAAGNPSSLRGVPPSRRSRGHATTWQRGYNVERGVFLNYLQAYYAHAQSHPGDLNISQEH